MVLIIDSQARSSVGRDTSRHTHAASEHRSHSRKHSQHRHRQRKLEDLDGDRTIVYVYKNGGRNSTSSDAKRTRSQDILSGILPSVTGHARSSLSAERRPESRGQSRRRHSFVEDVARRRPTRRESEAGGRSQETLMRRSTTHRRRGSEDVERPRVTRYG